MNTAKRDLSADLIRCLGCIFVLLLHLHLPFRYDQSAYAKLQIFITTLTADGVILFFAATGFFIFREKNILKRWKKALISVFIPGLIALFFYLFTHKWLSGEMSLSESLRSTGMADLKDLTFHLLRWSVPSYAGHLWYLEEYVKCLLYYPLLLFICTEDKTAVWVRRGAILLSFIFLLIRDSAHIGLSPMIHMDPFRIISTPAMMMLTGYELYDWKRKRKNRDHLHVPGFIIAITVFLLVNIVRTLLQYKAGSVNPSDEYFLSWDTSFSVTAGTAFMLGIFSLGEKPGFVNRFVQVTSPCTYGIYLIHVAVINILDRYQVRDRIIDTLQARTSFPGYLLLLLFTGLMSFFICLSVLKTWHAVKNLIKNKIIKRS